MKPMPKCTFDYCVNKQMLKWAANIAHQQLKYLFALSAKGDGVKKFMFKKL